MSIKAKIVLLSVLSCLALSAAFLGNVYYQKIVLTKQVDQELDTIIRKNTEGIARNVGFELKAINELLTSEVEKGVNVAWDIIKKRGGVSLDNAQVVQWKAVNQFTKKEDTIRIPKMIVGNTWLGQNDSFTQRSPLVDEINTLVGGTATIFQRINERGDMLRVSTNVKKNDGKRAVGTYIPAKDPDGKMNQVVKTLLKGKVYKGRAYVVNAWYLTSYRPLYDKSNKVVGAIYYGIMQEKTEALRQGIMNTLVGKNGYVWVVDQKGNFIISKDGKQDGRDARELTDSNGKHYVNDVIIKAMNQQKDDVVSFYNYTSKDSGEEQPTEKIAALTYFKPWDWVVATTAYVNDFKETEDKMTSVIANMLTIGLLIAFFILVIIVLLSLVLAGKITHPLAQLKEAADEISQGNLERSVDISGKDEIGQLAVAFKRMQASVVKLMARAQKKG